jgi:hypothetical protein
VVPVVSISTGCAQQSSTFSTWGTVTSQSAIQSQSAVLTDMNGQTVSTGVSQAPPAGYNWRFQFSNVPRSQPGTSYTLTVSCTNSDNPPQTGSQQCRVFIV